MRTCRIFLISLTLAACACASAIGDEPAAGTANGQSSTAAAEHSVFRFAGFEWLHRTSQPEAPQFGITIDPSNQQAPAERPLVILVHGYHSAPERLAALAATIRQAGYPLGTLRYPNDQPIADSAALLSAELRRLAKEQPGRKIVLITHSMGGLVAREAIENPALNPGNVEQLMMIAPPTLGTSCAYLTLSSDMWEHGATGSHRTIVDSLVASGAVCQADARDDLKPNSAFLQALNGRARNSSVRYTVFLGTGTKWSQLQLTHIREMATVFCQIDRFASAIEPVLQRALDDCEDAASPGDGVVSLARGRLDGVADTVLLGFDHWNVIGPPLAEPVAELHREIVNRLGTEFLAHNTNTAR